MFFGSSDQRSTRREGADSSFATSDWPVSNIDPKHSAMDQNGPCSREYLQPKDETIASLVDPEFKGAEDWFADWLASIRTTLKG